MYNSELTEPYVTLSIGEGKALTLTVSMSIKPGVANWNSSEAGEWFSHLWLEAEEILRATLVQQALPANGGLVRRGNRFWEAHKEVPVEATTDSPPVLTIRSEERKQHLQEERASKPAEALLPPKQSAVDPLLIATPHVFDDPVSPIAEPIPIAAAEEIEAASEPIEEVSTPRIPERLAATDDQKKVIRHLNRFGQPMSAASLQKETGLTAYRVGRAIESLFSKGVLQEEKKPSRGRWGEQAFYSSAAAAQMAADAVAVRPQTGTDPPTALLGAANLPEEATDES